MAWLSCSSGIIIINRYILTELQFGYPMALSALGQLVSCVVALIICDVFKMVPLVEIDMEYFLQRIAPVGAAHGIGLWVSNQLYLLLTVSFIEMARSLMPLFTVLALWAAKVEIPTNEHIQAVSLTGVGCGISAYGEVALSSLGLICLAANFAIEAGRMVMLQFLMQGHNMNPWQTLKLMTLPACGMLVLMTLIVESKEMATKNADAIVLANWPAFVAAGTLGLCVNILGNLIIKLSNATSVKLLAAVRGPMVVVSGVVLFSETVTGIQLFGYSLALAAFVWYNVLAAKSLLKRLET
eukprot:CAMPEP_0119102752 /NCGR_PEP_ID=MMETSP1180-20130426/1381_1 /TAXON_ID=3052 ORGANISM="Chlamydomonas cf sp, Strain CCMP681" /NCGR_SAMPLE_ID=MMETSP1180 /ASSEMBLY_ACC=CAM_ASM_000741 /LENGTH=296 /DNA_ID=CAMNT_0007087083 /DNA_START=146 /DNA_END=1036 /DNA_ORIENTATION=+